MPSSQEPAQEPAPARPRAPAGERPPQTIGERRVEELWEEHAAPRQAAQRNEHPLRGGEPATERSQPTPPASRAEPAPGAGEALGLQGPPAPPVQLAQPFPQPFPQPFQQPFPKPPPPPPADANPLPPVAEPLRTPVERRDLIQRFTPPSPLEGFWSLRRISRPGAIEPQKAVGYLAIGSRHLMLQLQIDGPSPRVPILQSGTRRYTVQGDALVTTSLVGLANEPNGDILLEQPGLTEMRRFTLLGSVLRILHEDGGHMEFVRVE